MSPPANGEDTWGEQVLHEFQGGADGAQPGGPLVMDSSGVLYGATQSGGTAGAGVVYDIVPPAAGETDWTENVIYTFLGGADGGFPSGGLLIADGALYGVTEAGGSTAGQNGGDGYGTVFRLSPPKPGETAWSKAILHSFKGGADGAGPSSALIADQAGGLYGTTVGDAESYTSAPDNYGTVFKLTPPKVEGKTWPEMVLHRFQGGFDGETPLAPLIADAAGNLYGTTTYGGGVSNSGNGSGTVFELSPPTQSGAAWTKTTLHNFQDGADGAFPSNGGLVFGAYGRLFGVTGIGSPRVNSGVAFELMPPSVGQMDWTEKEIYTFKGSTRGSLPQGALLRRPDGVHFGVTFSGGSHEQGVAYELSR